jgi:hypothetical protein
MLGTGTMKQKLYILIMFQNTRMSLQSPTDGYKCTGTSVPGYAYAYEFILHNLLCICTGYPVLNFQNDLQFVTVPGYPGTMESVGACPDSGYNGYDIARYRYCYRTHLLPICTAPTDYNCMLRGHPYGEDATNGTNKRS